MASKKQRRRREKELRHEYEYVYIDEAGKEVEVEQPPASSRKEKDRRPAASSSGRRSGQVRPVQPPTFSYLRRQAIIFFFIIFAAFAILNRSIPAAALMAVVYTALMLPLMWLTQRMIYRSYLRRTGQLPPSRKRGSK
jgi:Flp pilus assembly protein TadB